MRAGLVLEALTATHRVSVLVPPVYGPFHREMPEALRVLCEEHGKRAYPGRLFDTVHVFRLACTAAARPYLEAPNRPRRHLDLDDLESKTHRRLAALCRSNGDRLQGLAMMAIAKRIERWRRPPIEV